jgi:6-phosphofructokinase
MSCIKNLQDPDPANWIAAGCPLPAMMGVERRHGEDKAVITKALVKLDGPMFKCYEAVRRKWATLDCYQSPGPIQFQGAGSTAVNFMVKAPDIDAFVYETNIQERFESRHGTGDVLFRQESGLSALSRARIRAPVRIPRALTQGDFRLTAIKRYTPANQLVQMKIGDQHPHSDANAKSTHFVEIQESLVADQGKDHYLGEVIGRLNGEFAAASGQQGNRYSAATVKQTIAVMLLGAPAPGGNNIVDGLLQYQACRKGTTLLGYWNGVGGLRDDALVNITEESFAPYRNLGGYDYLGRSTERLAADLYGRAAESCRKHGITGLILVGATHALTDAAGLAEEFLRRKVTTGVVALPATLDGNIRHQFFQCALGFDTAAKVYSQLIGNMLTDSASAIKYWYFIRLMGKDPSHLALECALKTHPNMVLISEECAFRGETLPDVVSRICDLVAERAAQGKNFGSVLIPEGLLSHISAFKHLMAELNALFSNCKTPEEKHALP